MKRHLYATRKKLAQAGQPSSVSEWESYIALLCGQALWEQAIAANSQEFLSRMQGEGMSMDDIEAVLRAFAQQFVAVGMKIPEEGVFDIIRFADDVRPTTRVFSDQEVLALEAGMKIKIKDELDFMFDGSAD